jgi:orotate phosphoribosyltransferase-like protein
MTHTKQTRDEFIELRAEGLSLGKIARELDIAYNTAERWDDELVMEICTAKAFKVEEMVEKYRMTKEKRIELYGERLLALQDELARRDLSEILTNKLFDMMMKCAKAFEAEIPSTKFMSEEDILEEKKAKWWKYEPV